MNSEWVVVFTAQGESEENQVCAFLRAHGIPTQVSGEALRKTHGFVLDGLGEVTVMVPRPRAGEARELIDRVERGDLALPDEE